MDDLISRQAAIDALRTCQTYLFNTYDDDKKISLESAEYMIEQLPSAQPDAVPVVHGMWIRDEFGTQCSVCCLYAYRDKFDQPWESPYCPNCGADMRGEK